MMAMPMKRVYKKMIAMPKMQNQMKNKIKI